MITLDLGDSGAPVPFHIDSGSECCVLPRHEYVKVTGDRSLATLRPVKTVIVTYDGTREKSLGQCKLSVVVNLAWTHPRAWECLRSRIQIL